MEERRVGFRRGMRSQGRRSCAASERERDSGEESGGGEGFRPQRHADNCVEVGIDSK
jgi:hypothetical protein